MSLDWSITKVRDNDEIMDGGLEANITQALVFHSMAVGMGRITESNWQEFYARVNVIETHDKPSLSVPDLVEYNPSAVEPPEGTRYVEVNGTIYHYNGIFPDHYDEDNDAVVIALDLHYYEHNGFTESRGTQVIFIPSEGDTFAYHNGFKPRPITPQDVHRRIGLSTNVADESRAKWTKRMMDYWLETGTRRAERSVTLT